MKIFYRPADAVAADVIPFFHGGEQHLFYLKDWRDIPRHGEGTPWFHLATRDHVAFRDLGEAIPRGPIGAQDRWIYTGCVFEHEGRFHLFYTAHNEHLPKVGRLKQTIAMATSSDLIHWTKDPTFEIRPLPGYAPDDWRDPFVFWNEEAGEFQMLLAARRLGMPDRQSGCTARLGSTDLRTWNERQPLYAPDQYFTHECPDLFRLGDWWYLVFSEFSQTTQTRYRMARHREGPWLTPADDCLDSRAWYAAKTSSDGRRRFAYGWLATRVGETDDGGWMWGGDLVVHELSQRADGTLVAGPVPELLAAFGAGQPLQLQPRFGPWTWDADGAACTRLDGQAVLTMGPLADHVLLDATITWSDETEACGLLLRASDDLSSWYQIRVEPRRKRMVIDRCPRPGDQPFLLERPLPCSGSVRLRCVIDGSCLVVYADGATALSCRLYRQQAGSWGLFVEGGSVRFTGLAQRGWTGG